MLVEHEIPRAEHHENLVRLAGKCNEITAQLGFFSKIAIRPLEALDRVRERIR